MMVITRKRLVGALLTGAFTVGLAAPVFALGGTTPPTDPAKCNSGRGNGAEVAGNDCDPGRSAGHNMGGDS